MQKIKIGIKNISNNDMPSYATEGSSGLDIKAWLKEPIMLCTLERYAVPTGLFLEIPRGFEAQIRPRSGLALKQGLTCLNTPGTIDSDYRGELRVIIINLSKDQQIINNGDRIAQIVFQKIEEISWDLKTELSETVRGDGGFGHTGKT